MLNAIVGSLFVYKMNVVPLTDDEERAEINQGLNQYLWNGAKPKVDILTLSRKREQRGLKLFNLEKKDLALKMQWAKEIASLADYLLNNKMCSLIWRWNLSKDHSYIMINGVRVSGQESLRHGAQIASVFRKIKVKYLSKHCGSTSIFSLIIFLS